MKTLGIGMIYFLFFFIFLRYQYSPTIIPNYLKKINNKILTTDSISNDTNRKSQFYNIVLAFINVKVNWKPILQHRIGIHEC